MTQNDQILRHLKEGHTLTPAYALRAFRCFRLAARVKELRDLGHPIRTEIVEANGGARIAGYRLGAK